MSARAYGLGSAQKGRSPPRTMHHLNCSVEASALNVEASALIVEASALYRSNRHSPQRPKRLSLHSSHTQQGQEQHGYETPPEMSHLVTTAIKSTLLSRSAQRSPDRPDEAQMKTLANLQPFKEAAPSAQTGSTQTDSTKRANRRQQSHFRMPRTPGHQNQTTSVRAKAECSGECMHKREWGTQPGAGKSNGWRARR